MISLSLPGVTRRSIETKDLRVCGSRSPGRARGLRSNASRSRLLRFFVLRRPGGSSEELEPDPIPNSAVKLLSANGTMA